MAVSFFNRKLEQPDMTKFDQTLNSETAKLWKTLTGDLQAVYPQITFEWEYLSKRLGWFLICKSRADVLFYIVPQAEYFQVNFTFDEETYNAVQSSNLPDKLIKYIQTAEVIDRGHSFFISVRKINDVELVEMLLQMQEEMREQQ